MENNEIKKILYKENPTAKLLYIRKQVAHYSWASSVGEFFFNVPVNDMGEADFFPFMQAKLLIRYLQ